MFPLFQKLAAQNPQSNPNLCSVPTDLVLKFHMKLMGVQRCTERHMWRGYGVCKIEHSLCNWPCWSILQPYMRLWWAQIIPTIIILPCIKKLWTWHNLHRQTDRPSDSQSTTQTVIEQYWTNIYMLTFSWTSTNSVYQRVKLWCINCYCSNNLKCCKLL